MLLQAPESMKSVVQAAWLLTTALGDVIVVIVAGVQLFNQVSSSLVYLNSCVIRFLPTNISHDRVLVIFNIIVVVLPVIMGHL